MVDLQRVAQDWGYQTYMIERYALLYGEARMLELLGAFAKPPVPSIRVNPHVASPATVRSRLESKGFRLDPIPWCPEGFWIYPKGNAPGAGDPGAVPEFKLSPGATHEYLLGQYSLQGSSSMIPAMVLDPGPGDEVLDMAAAPGSKFVQMACMMQNKGILVGVERDKDRVGALKANVQRSGIRNAVIICNDARHLEEQFSGFDKILVDAPCTGEGLIGSDPSRKMSRSVGDIETMMRIQVQLLQKAGELLKPGGRIVYSTCSLAPEENENVVTQVIKANKKLSVLPVKESIARHFDTGIKSAFTVDFNPGLVHAVRVLPLHHPTRPEGFFIALIGKAGR